MDLKNVLFKLSFIPDVYNVDTLSVTSCYPKMFTRTATQTNKLSKSLIYKRMVKLLV